ncbi:hypothetical protein COV82_05395 [Candidatus Peregrinibacteria bacterium CG11_big_fil_rev_8_21_14_0_20_46_8]|nr:MAG: hypothetical protein COV82_05395 [Candidatus Peregrinibacteria bacterium CG11_big_fil_rev_8_21_14_0_20_46_8]
MKNSQFVTENSSKTALHFRDLSGGDIATQSNNHQKLTDKNLYSLCKMYGAQALQARRKFAGLLPEVERRKLFEQRKFLAKRSFYSIYEFAARLAGMSRDQVDVVLRLDRKFQELPQLHALLVNGEVSHNKLIRVASIATKENETELARAVQKLSKAAIDAFVRDVKYAKNEMEIQTAAAQQNDENKIQDGLFEPKTGQDSLPVQSGPRAGGDERTGGDELSQKFESTNNTAEKNVAASKNLVLGMPTTNDPNGTAQISAADLNLLAALSPRLKTKLHELLNKGLDLNQILLQLLVERDEKIEDTKQKIALEQNEKEEVEKNIGKRTSRHIPAAIRKIIHAEFGTVCSISGCIKPAANLHHTQRFAVSQSHNPYFIAPLCKGHHDIAHKMDGKYATQTRAV